MQITVKYKCNSCKYEFEEIERTMNQDDHDYIELKQYMCLECRGILFRTIEYKKIIKNIPKIITNIEIKEEN